MVEIIVIVLIVGIFWLLMRAYKSFITRRMKMKLGVVQVLNDGAIVEAMDADILPSSELPFNGNLLASFFATYLVMRESKGAGNWHGLLSAYLFKWEIEGIIQSEMTSETDARLIFTEIVPTEAIELELYEILKSNDMFGDAGFDYDKLKDWSKKVLALGEAELLEAKDVAFDQKGRIRFTRQGYKKSLDHGSFAKYFMTLSSVTFCELDFQRQQQELSFALLLELTEDIEKVVGTNGNVSVVLKAADRVWRVL